MIEQTTSGDMLTYFKNLTRQIYSYRLDDENIVKNTGKMLNKIFKTFYDSFLFYSPDISGYTLFFLIPPHLSAKEYESILGKFDNMNKYFRYMNVAIPFLAVDVNPPSKNVKIGEYSLRTGGIPTAEEVESSGDLSVSYMETSDLHIYSFHSIWIKYIDEVSKGIVKPAEEYIYEGNIDYATCAYCLKFRPNGELIYFARYTGLIPTTLSSKDIIGSRSDFNHTIVNVSYTCPFPPDEFTYPELVMSGASLDNPNNHPFLKDFVEKINNFLRY